MKFGKVEFSGWFLLLIAWLFYHDDSGIVCLTLLSCFLHEAAHYVVLLYFRKRVKGIYITLFGARIILEDSLSYIQELICSAAGPGLNLVLAYLSCLYPPLHIFSGINLALAVFNLLPVGQMDGARMLRSFLALITSDEKSFFISDCLDFTFTVLALFTGFYMAVRGRNLTLILLCFWLLKHSCHKKSAKTAEKE